jgi:hypothetical protein
MIVIDIINSIFDILPQLILATSPACVFGGMGSGSQSGKLTFKKIFSGEGIQIVEDSSSLKLSTTGGAAIGINSCEIVIGNALTGITGSNNICTCDAYKAITGVDLISGTFSPSSYTLSVTKNGSSSLIIGGRNITIDQYSQCKNIIGGDVNKTEGDLSLRVCTIYGSILGGRCNTLSCGSGNIINSFCSEICGAPISNSIIGGSKNCIYAYSGYTVRNTAILGGCSNRMLNNRYSSIINSNGTTSDENFTTSINSLGTTKNLDLMSIDIGGCNNNTGGIYGKNFSFISSKCMISGKCTRHHIDISSQCSLINASTSSVVISSKCSFIDVGLYGSIISSCNSTISGEGATFSQFNSIISSEFGKICMSFNSSIISSISGTISNSKSSTILSSCGTNINNSSGSVLSSMFVTQSVSGIYGSTNSVAMFKEDFCVSDSISTVDLVGWGGSSTRSIDSGSIGLRNLSHRGDKFSCRNFILSFDTVSICSGVTSSCDNFVNACCTFVCDSIRSSVVSSTNTLILGSRNSSIIGSYCSCITGSTNSIIIGSRCVCITNSRNSAIVAGIIGSSLSGCCETTRTGHLQVTTCTYVGSSHTAAVNYCSFSGSISSITVCNGIITAIS